MDQNDSADGRAAAADRAGGGAEGSATPRSGGAAPREAASGAATTDAHADQGAEPTKGDGGAEHAEDGQDRKGKEDGSDEKKDGDAGGEADKGKDGDKANDGDKKDDHPVRRAKWPWIVGGAVILVFIVVVMLILFLPKSWQKTDDAYVRAHYAVIAPRISGQVVAVRVNDNQPVHRGDLLIAIDPRDYQAALNRALAKAAEDRAQVGQAQAEITRQSAVIDQADAQIGSSSAALALSDANARRYTGLAATGAGSQQLRQQSDSQMRQDEASVRQSRANLRATRDQLGSLVANRQAALARVKADQADIDQARLNLSFTRVFAPIDGLVDQRSVQLGQYVSPGAAVMTVVPLHAVYIEARYREIALHSMLPGQHVRIHLDAYDAWLDGYVQSIAAATGASYSPIPPDNATGNFTKIVQRLPVKIVVAPNQPLARLLRVGMSVETWVDIRQQGPNTGLQPVGPGYVHP